MATININNPLTLEQLEKKVWDPIEDGDTPLIIKCKNLRKKPLNKFTVENLRLMIGQDIGRIHLVPIAIEKFLSKNLLIEADYFEGDLLLNCLRIGEEFWIRNPKLYKRLYGLIKESKLDLDEFNGEIEYFFGIQTTIKKLSGKNSVKKLKKYFRE